MWIGRTAYFMYGADEVVVARSPKRPYSMLPYNECHVNPRFVNLKILVRYFRKNYTYYLC